MRVPVTHPTRRLSSDTPILIGHDPASLMSLLDERVQELSGVTNSTDAQVLQRAMTDCLSTASFDVERDFSIPNGCFYNWAISQLSATPARDASATTPARRFHLPAGVTLHEWYLQTILCVMAAHKHRFVRLAGEDSNPPSSRAPFGNQSWVRPASPPCEQRATPGPVLHGAPTPPRHSLPSTPGGGLPPSPPSDVAVRPATAAASDPAADGIPSSARVSSWAVAVPTTVAPLPSMAAPPRRRQPRALASPAPRPAAHRPTTAAHVRVSRLRRT